MDQLTPEASHRLQKPYRELVREEVANTVSSGAVEITLDGTAGREFMIEASSNLASTILDAHHHQHQLRGRFRFHFGGCDQFPGAVLSL